MKLKYKFLRLIDDKIKSNSGDLTWNIGEWIHHDEELDICNSGLHCSKYPDQAFCYVKGEILAPVETKGKKIINDDKECWSDMRIVRAYQWQKKDSVALAIYAAELVIDIFEKEHPNDKRPRQAIEAAKEYLKNPRAAAAAAAARAAWDAAWAAAAAADAARAAWAAAAASDAAWAAADAADAARAAADAADAARAAAITKKIRTWMIKRINELEELK